MFPRENYFSMCDLLKLERTCNTYDERTFDLVVQTLTICNSFNSSPNDIPLYKNYKEHGVFVGRTQYYDLG
jgi:hypothetical protein